MFKLTTGGVLPQTSIDQPFRQFRIQITELGVDGCFLLTTLPFQFVGH
jgi:hypothetical protein